MNKEEKITYPENDKRSYSILIIDDQLVVAETLAEILKDPQYKITVLTDPKKALASIDKTHFDIVITDWVMPEIGGDKILQKIKDQPNKLTLAIIVSGQATVNNAIQALQLGAYDYITKPFNQNQILAVVRKAIQHLSLEKRNRLLDTRIKKLLSNMTLLYDLSSILYQVSELEAAEEMILDTFREYFKLQKVAISMEDEVSGENRITCAYGVSEEFEQRLQFRLNSMINNTKITGDTVEVFHNVSENGFKADKNGLVLKEGNLVLTLFPLRFRDKTIGFIHIFTTRELDTFLIRLIKIYSTQIGPVLYTFLDHKKNEIISDAYIYKLLKESIYQSQMMLSPLSFILFRVVIKEKCDGTLLLNDVVKTYREFFKSRCTRQGELIWLTLDTALLILPETDLFAAESLSSKLIQELETLTVGNNKKGLLTLQYACADYPQLGEDAREIYSMLWVKLLEESNMKNMVHPIATG